MSGQVLELAADQRARKTGTAKPLDPQPEIETEDTGGDVDLGGKGPPKIPRGWPRRPDRPPRWMRLFLYGAMLICCFLIGWIIGKIWDRIDRAAWGPGPLLESDS